MRGRSRSSIAKIRGGFTLVEVVTSLAIMTVLMLGLSGAVMISVHAIPSDEDMGLKDQEVIDVLNKLRSDLSTATNIRYRTESDGWTLKLAQKANASLGSPTEILYTYTPSNKNLYREVDTQGSNKVLGKTTLFAWSFDELGGDTVSAYAMMSEQDTIQMIYEMHVLLPDRPTFE